MPQIRTRSLPLAVLSSLLVLALSGCGDVNSKANFDSSAGEHVASWLPEGHRAAAQADITGCTACHGSALDGGISRVSCLTCHIGSPTSVHPVLWNDMAYALHAGYVKQLAVDGATGTETCVPCHGADLLGNGDPEMSCGINCHMAGTPQAPQTHAWTASSTAEQIAGHKAYFEANGEDYTTCRNAACHGANLGGAWLTGPSCIGSGCHGSGNPLPAEQD